MIQGISINMQTIVSFSISYNDQKVNIDFLVII